MKAPVWTKLLEQRRWRKRWDEGLQTSLLAGPVEVGLWLTAGRVGLVLPPAVSVLVWLHDVRSLEEVLAGARPCGKINQGCEVGGGFFFPPLAAAAAQMDGGYSGGVGGAQEGWRGQVSVMHLGLPLCGFRTRSHCSLFDLISLCFFFS